jgi:ankyrin repeat protein
MATQPLYAAIGVAAIQQLLDRGADIKQENIWGNRPLHIAAYRGDTAAVRLLLDNRADIEAKNLDGETALQMAVLARQEEVVLVLLEKGANSMTKYDFRSSILHSTIRDEQEELVELVLDNAVDIDAKNEAGDTACQRQSSSGLISAPSSWVLPRKVHFRIYHSHISSKRITSIEGLLLGA